MGGIKTPVTVELNENHKSWLTQMTEKYGLFDEDKALRIILDFIIDEASVEKVFTEVRCNHCNDSKNQD